MKEGCHSDILGPQPRGRTTESWMPDGYYLEQVGMGPDGPIITRVPKMKLVRTEWLKERDDGLPMSCGIKKQPGYTSVRCEGCTNYPEKKK